MLIALRTINVAFACSNYSRLSTRNDLFIRPSVRSNVRSYKMLVMFLFFPTRNLRDPSADHRETLPHDWKLVLFYYPTSKIWGGLSPKKIWGPKTCKISVNFTQPPTWIANISERLKISKIRKLMFPARFLLRSQKKVR